MQLLYEHRTPPRTAAKVLLILAGAGLVVMQLVRPLDGLWQTWGLWALASALMLAGAGLLVLPPMIHLWITSRDIILHPLRLHQRIPIRQIHDMELAHSDTGATLTLHLRDGAEVDLTHHTPAPTEVHKILSTLGVASRQFGRPVLSDSLGPPSGVDLRHGKTGEIAETNRKPEQDQDENA